VKHVDADSPQFSYLFLLDKSRISRNVFVTYCRYPNRLDDLLISISNIQ
jgi:hypothetical protein